MPLRKILIADDHSLFRKGVSNLLKNEWPQIEIIEAANGFDTITQVKHHKPDVVLIDHSMPDLNGYEASQQLLKNHTNLKIIMLTGYDTMVVALNFLKIGGRGFSKRWC